MSEIENNNVLAGQPGFVDEKQLLKRLPVSRRTLFAWRQSGKIPFVRVPGSRRILFHWPTVEATLLRRQKGNAAEAPSAPSPAKPTSPKPKSLLEDAADAMQSMFYGGE